MKIKTLLCAGIVGLAAVSAYGQTTLFSDDFESGSLTTKGWTIIGSDLYGGAGVGQDSVNYPTTSHWAYFQTQSSGPAANAGIYANTGATGLAGQTIQVNFDLGGKNNVQLYNGTFTASLWDGNPTTGTQLGSLVISGTALPAGGVSLPETFSVNLSANTANDLYVQFFAATPPSGGFKQPIIDNVSVIAVPEPSTVVLALLFGTGMLLLFRRRRIA